MNDSFVPLVAAAPKPRENGFVSLSSKPAPATAAKPGDESKPAANPSASTSASDACAKPTVTLQRNGDVVTAIRVQCNCGQVVELACVY